MERVAFRPVRGAPPITLLLTSLGLSHDHPERPPADALQRRAPNDIRTGSWSYSTFHIGERLRPVARRRHRPDDDRHALSPTMFLRQSVRGLALRAAAEDFTMTRMMGIRADTVIMPAFLSPGCSPGSRRSFTSGYAPARSVRLRLQPAAEGVHRRRDRRSWEPERRRARRFYPRVPRDLLQVTLPAENTPFSTRSYSDRHRSSSSSGRRACLQGAAAGP